MDNVKPHIRWHSNLESYFKEIGEKSNAYSYLHKKSEAYFSKRTTFIDLPVIVLSTVAGTLSIGSNSIFGSAEASAGMWIGCLSIGVSVMNTIGTYFNWNKRAENHRICSIQYSKLYRFISVELNLPIEERMSANDMLKVIRENYERLAEISPLIPTPIINAFKIKFKDADISKPEETNGLDPIDIYRPPTKFKQRLMEAIEREESVHASVVDEENQDENQIVPTETDEDVV